MCSCGRNSSESKFILYNQTDIDYDSIIISDGQRNQKKIVIFGIDLKKRNDYIEGEFDILIYKKGKNVKEHSFGFLGLGSFYSTYKVNITKDSIYTEEISTKIWD